MTLQEARTALAQADHRLAVTAEDLRLATLALEHKPARGVDNTGARNRQKKAANAHREAQAARDAAAAALAELEG